MDANIEQQWGEFGKELFMAYARAAVTQDEEGMTIIMPIKWHRLYNAIEQKIDILNFDNLYDFCCWAAQQGQTSTSAVITMLEMCHLNKPRAKSHSLDFAAALVGTMLDRKTNPHVDGKLAFLVGFFGFYVDEQSPNTIDKDAILQNMRPAYKERLLPKPNETFKEWANSPMITDDLRSIPSEL